MGLREGGRRDGCDRGARGRPRRLHRLALLGPLLVLFLLGGAGPASAHAGLGGTDPRDGTVLDSAPRHLTLNFTESVGLLDDSVRVIGPDNRRVRTGEAELVDGGSDTVRLSLPPGLRDGTYTVAWRVVSADSHPVSGAFLFSVGAPSATTTAVTAPTEDPATTGLYNIARYAAYAALALLVGVLVFTAAVLGGPSEALRRLVPAAGTALLASTAVLLLVRGPYERGTGLADVLDPGALTATLTSRPGMALLARPVLLAGVFLLVRRAPRPWRRGHAVLGGVLAVGLALTWAAAEHASAGIQVPLAMTSSVLHLLAMAVWLGGLAALLTVLRRAPRDLTLPAVTRFSRLALACVAVLTVTGAYQSWRGLGSWDALTGTAYGRLLLAKLVAVTLLLAAAAVSRRWTSDWASSAGVNRESAETASAGVGGESAEAASAGVGGSAEGASAGEPRVAAEVASGVAVASSAGGPGAVAGVVEGAPTGTSGATAEGESGPASGPPARGFGDAAARSAGDTEDPALPARSAPPDGTHHRRALRRSVGVEFATGVVVLAITTLLTVTLPGRADAESAAARSAQASGTADAFSGMVPFDVGTPTGRGKAQIEVSPGRVGTNRIQVVTYGPDDGLSIVPEVRLTFTLRAQDVGPIDAELENRGGYWATDSLRLPLPGVWTMKITVRTTETDQVTVEKDIRVG
ncbi:copper resistance protein CopC [Streptomyces sp. AS58]|uniref:copper resistance protein CopC n=1 Tax=Streptomyces sp. AS58 TaxID=1519489 RepID=UPI00099B3A60|nr:copper resistance protein CopC [Streptomyces sp. AS58]